jgi:capsular exopolysaccharide synthesis family protein
MAVVGLLLALAPRTYLSEGRVFVASSDPQQRRALDGSLFVQDRVTTYAELVRSPRVLDPVIAELGLRTTADALGQHVRGTVPLGTSFVDISVTDGDPEQAAAIATSVMRQFSLAIADLEQSPGSAASPLRITTVRNPPVPSKPLTPHVIRDLGIAAILGLALAAGWVWFRSGLDTKIRRPEDLPSTDGVVSIGFIPRFTGASSLQGSHRQGVAEVFKALRSNFKFVSSLHGSRTVVICSTAKGEGATTVAANLAEALAVDGARVCLVDANLRTANSGVQRSPMSRAPFGLTDMLVGRADDEHFAASLAPGEVSFIPPGPVPPNPNELLGSVEMRHLLASLREAFDYVLIDAPAVGVLSDGAVLASMADASVLVVGMGSVRAAAVSDSLASLKQAGSTVLGIVANGVDNTHQDRYEYAPESSAVG